MTSRRDRLYAALQAGSPVCAVYCDEAPEGAPRRKVIYQVIYGSDEYTLDGPVAGARWLVQFDCYDESPEEADVLVDEVLALLHASSGFSVDSCSVSGAQGRDEETQLSCASRELSIWFD